MGYRFIHFVIDLIFRLFTRIHVYGFENLPRSGAFIIAANHLGRLDAPLVYYLLDRRDLVLMVAEKYQKVPFFRYALKQLNGIWVDRYNADISAMRACLQRLRQGAVLVLSPEGTRSQTQALQTGRPGASFLAAKAGVPIVPVGLTGTEDAVVKQRLSHFRKADLTVNIGLPFTLPPVPAKDREEALQRYTDEIMCQIGALLPPAYRGVYTGHPRLNELLA